VLVQNYIQKNKSGKNKNLILDELSDKPITFNKLLSKKIVSRPILAKHLKKLIEAEFIEKTSKGYIMSKKGARRIKNRSGLYRIYSYRQLLGIDRRHRNVRMPKNAKELTRQFIRLCGAYTFDALLQAVRYYQNDDGFESVYARKWLGQVFDLDKWAVTLAYAAKDLPECETEDPTKLGEKTIKILEDSFRELYYKEFMTLTTIRNNLLRRTNSEKKKLL